MSLLAKLVFTEEKPEAWVSTEELNGANLRKVRVCIPNPQLGRALIYQPAGPILNVYIIVSENKDRCTIREPTKKERAYVQRYHDSIPSIRPSYR